jgi:DNA polymerase III alpha subunit
LSDRATFTIAGAISQVDRKFTKKEGKPFAVVFLEDLTGTLEVVLWNETYVTVAHALEPGSVIAIRGTIDKRDDTSVRRRKGKSAYAGKRGAVPSKTTNGSETNGAARVREDTPITLRFAAGIGADELRTVRQILASSPGITARHAYVDE